MSDRASQRAEESVIGALLRSDDARLEVVGLGLEPEHFFYRPYRLLYENVVERYYADDPIDALTVAEALGPHLSKAWSMPEREVVDKVTALTAIDTDDTTTIAEHARIVKRHADYRELTRIAANAVDAAQSQAQDPDAIAGELTSAATRIVTAGLRDVETLSYRQLGSRWTQTQRGEIAARAAGVEIGAKFGIKAVDDFVKGARPGELIMLGGDPGVGKSALAWAMARGFARRQMKRPEDQRIGTMIWSGEMAEDLSSTRFAQLESRVPGETLREGLITQSDLTGIAKQWAGNADLPLYVNHSGELRQAQLKAIVTYAVQRFNVGVLFIDHFRFIRTDERFEKVTEAEDEIVRYLKATLARDLNIVVVCLAHTTKNDSKRPVMDDLRGSKMISAFADVVMFPFWPWKWASTREREQGVIGRHDFELIFDKVRSSAPGTGELYMDLSTMTIS